MMLLGLCRRLGLNPERILPRRLRILEECKLFLRTLESLTGSKVRPSTRQECPVCGRQAVLTAGRERTDPLRRVRVRLRCTVCPHVVSVLVRPEECLWALPMAEEAERQERLGGSRRSAA
jgi:hypothetical protein